MEDENCCGNGNCVGENSAECPQDCCGVTPEECGDGLDNDCDGQVDEDCCGDGICSGIETYLDCIDCGYCGDGICDTSYEDYELCPDDCEP